MKNIIFILLLMSAVFILKAEAQLENVPAGHPVYLFLERYEAAGFLPHFSTSDIPLSRKVISNALQEIRKKEDRLSKNEIAYLKAFELEFSDNSIQKNVIFNSRSDSGALFFKGIISSREKYFYYFRDSSSSVRLVPLGSFEAAAQKSENGDTRSVFLGTLGLRLHGTIDNLVGYYLQATNGAVLSGDRNLAMEDPRLVRNVKFTRYDSDFDFTESHVRLEKSWFYASIGRETRLLGSGLNHRLFVSANAPPLDAVDLGASFKLFEYRFTHASLLPYLKDDPNYGFVADLPSKYMTMHRFALMPAWGEIAFWESVVYSDRGIDLAYLNPLSFFKSLEHALHDRDNSAMGFDVTLRPLSRLQFKGSFLLDDIIFSEIGNGFWSNKTAFNASVMYVSPWDFDIGFEYARVEPYTFSHFNYLNSMTNDSMVFAGSLPPNSDEFSVLLRLWPRIYETMRYPVEISLNYRQHGRNIYDENDSLIKNVGGDAMISRRLNDPEYVTFLDGDMQYTFLLSFNTGVEILRQFSAHLNYMLKSANSDISHYVRFTLRFEDF